MTKKGLVQSRLDYWLISNHLMYDFHQQDIKPGLRSDHSLVTLSFKIKNTQQKGRGFFKFNSSLLRDKIYVEKVNELIQENINANKEEEDKGLLWDSLKCSIIGMTISYSTQKARETRKLEKELKERLQQIEENLTEAKLDEYKTIKGDLEDIYNEQARGCHIRSKAKLVEESEKNLNYFAKLEIKNSKTKYIKTLITEGQEKVVTDPGEILEAQKDFYKQLYSEPRGIQLDADIFKEIKIPQLEEIEKKLCDEEITMEEVAKSLKELPNNKTPGTDGLTTDFYKFFWPKIKQIVYDSIIFAFKSSKLSIEQRRGILSIIPKKSKDLRYLKFWRPLTLLNTDYKIITKLLAIRLQKVLPSIINMDQSGYLKGRYIGDNIRTIFDTMQYTMNNQIPGMMVLLDFEKAFDSISWPFLQEALKAFNFGLAFRKWVQILYSDPECCVVNNWYSSSFFNPSRGIRQGCPISALLFLLVVEIMALHIRQSKSIEGIKVEGCSIKITQLADDTTLFLKDTPSLRSVFSFLDRFNRCSGLKLNRSKTEIMWIGSERHSCSKPLGLKIAKDSVKCLGVLCNTDVQQAITENFEEKV